MSNENANLTKVIVPCRFSYLHCWEPNAVSDGDPKYSVSAIIPKSDTETIEKIKKAIEQAKKDSVSKWGGKVPANLKLPLRDGDIDRPEDEAYADSYLGYGGSTGALISMGALDMGLAEDELSPLVAAWRKANPHITQFWWDVDAAAIKAVTKKQKTKVGKIIFEYKSGILFITLPSGRKLSYVKPRMAVNRFGRDGLTYEGISENKKWSRIETYGPKLVENIVQGTARDLLAEAMLRVEKKGYSIVMHCHDEIIAEVPEGIGSVEEMCEVMAVQPEWAEGLPLRADGYSCSFYQKQ